MTEATTQQPKRKISPEKHREYGLRAEARHPEKIDARIRCREAIKRGDLVRQPCEKCTAEPAQAHHDDYSKPLEVRWLCTKHHAEHHAEQRRALGIRIQQPSRSKPTHCKRGHEFTPENTLVYPSDDPRHRRCRICRHDAEVRKALRYSQPGE